MDALFGKLEKRMDERMGPLAQAIKENTEILKKELKDYEQVFLTKDILTGHIDILRYENDGQVGIWDYKPESLKEQNAKIQIFLYAIMLSIRTGVCLKNVICGYFDESDIFFFEPYQVERFNGQFYHA